MDALRAERQPEGAHARWCGGATASVPNAKVLPYIHRELNVMIRLRRIPQDLLDAWLVDQKVESSNAKYSLKVLRSDASAFDAIKAEVRDYIKEALEDARLKIRKGFEDALSPFDEDIPDPAANYPQLLNIITLKGYWGETLAAIGVEGWGAHGYKDWVVPAMLFRIHDQEFQHLEEINQRIDNGENYDPDAESERRTGRTGDDALAFRLNDDDVITDILTFESKCLSTSNAEKIKEAHEKLSAGQARPTGIRELINLLDDYETEAADRWRQSLLFLWRDGYHKAKRLDGLAYACGNVPKTKGRVSWLDATTPHAEYKTSRSLTAFEFQFANLDEVVIALYR